MIAHSGQRVFDAGNFLAITQADSTDQRFSVVTIPHMQTVSSPGRRLISKPRIFGLLLLLLGTSTVFAPRSAATRQLNDSINPGFQALTSEKRRRPEFVPGEALVRFKKNRAFEGATHLAVPRNDASIQPSQGSGSRDIAAPAGEVLVDVKRFEGSD